MTACSGVRPLTGLIGARITRVRHIHYVYRGMPDTGYGPLELTFGGRVILLDGAADGEALRVSTQLWQDPFAGPLSDENRAYVDKSGQWLRSTSHPRVPLGHSPVTSWPALRQSSPTPAK